MTVVNSASGNRALIRVIQFFSWALSGLLASMRLHFGFCGSIGVEISRMRKVHELRRETLALRALSFINAAVDVTFRV